MTTNITTHHTSAYRGRTVLVTGGMSAFGSTLVHRLVSHGARVTVIDTLANGSIDNLAASAKEITFLLGSITNTNLVTKALTGATHLFHLAPPCAAPDADDTRLLYEAAARAGVQSIIFASSGEVYETSHGLCSESTAPAPRSPRGHAALAGERLGQTLAQQTHIHVANLRFFQASDIREQHEAVTATLQAGIIIGMRGQVINVSSNINIDTTRLKRLLAHR